MLDPSLPWLAAGYKNFQKEDLTKTHSYDDITKLYHVNKEDFVKKELRSSTPELRQRRRVKSATVHRQLNGHAGKERPPRPKTALGMTTVKNHASRLGSSPTRPGSSQSYCRERVGCYDYISDHPLPQSYIKPKPRPKSAIFIRHRPSSLDRKSVSLVERQYHKEHMAYSLSVEEEDTRCAFCPSSSNRPTSSTGLVAASLPTQFDRYTFWTRPRTAPSTKREFQQKPRHNTVHRGRVPHYTNFIKRIDLGLRDQTPSPPPPRARRAFEEPAKPAPPREPRESRQRKQVPKPEPHKEPPAPVVEPEEVEEELVVLEEAEKTIEEPVRIPTPIEDPPQEEEIEPPEEVPSAWTEPRAPTPTPTASPPPEPAEEERIPTPPPPRELTPPPVEEPKPSTPPPPEPEPPKEPTPPPTPPREPTPPPPPEPEPEPEPPPPQEPTPKPKKEVRIHDPPVVEPPPRPPSQKKEKKPSNLVKRPSFTKKPEPKPEPPPPAQPKPSKEPVKEPVKEQEPKPPVKQVEVPSLPKVKAEEPKPVVIETPEISKPPEEPPKEDETPAKDEADEEQKKKQLGPPPPKVKVDVFGRSMDPEYMKQLLDLEMRSRRRGNQDEDEDDFEYSGNYRSGDTIPDSAIKQSKIESWLKGRMALSKRASRFELPMDVKELEGMTPIAYLERYCIVNRRRAALYRRAFNRVDRDCDLKINVKEMEKAIEDALVDTVQLDQISYVLSLIQAEEDIKIRPKLFSAICALLERLFYHEFVTEDTVEMEGNTKERVETADFSALDWKLEGCTVNPPLKKLLYRLL